MLIFKFFWFQDSAEVATETEARPESPPAIVETVAEETGTGPELDDAGRSVEHTHTNTETLDEPSKVGNCGSSGFLSKRPFLRYDKANFQIFWFQVSAEVVTEIDETTSTAPAVVVEPSGEARVETTAEEESENIIAPENIKKEPVDSDQPVPTSVKVTRINFLMSKQTIC